MAYAEAVDDTEKMIGLINRLCEQGYEMQHGHMDDFMKSQIDSESFGLNLQNTTRLTSWLSLDLGLVMSSAVLKY